MHKKPDIRIRYGASTSTVTVDGHVFDRAPLNRADDAKLRHILVGALEKIGYFATKGRKK